MRIFQNVYVILYSFFNILSLRSRPGKKNICQTNDTDSDKDDEYEFITNTGQVMQR